MTERTSDTGAAMSPPPLPPLPPPEERPGTGSGGAPPAPDADVGPGAPTTRGKPGAPAKPLNTRRPRSAAKRAAKPRATAPVRHDPAPVPSAAGAPALPADTDEADETSQDPAPPEEAEPPRPVPDPPGDAFDALYAAHSTPLVQQTYLLTGRRWLAKEAVERAFHLAWQRWPEVATDADPAGWLRAAAHEYALSPWHRFRPAHRHPDRPPADPELRTLLRALLDLPPRYRRTLLLYDGLGLDLPETAAETEASTPAAANRLLHAREAVAAHVPELAAAATPEALSELLRRRIGELALAESRAVTRLPGPWHVRTGGERRIRIWTRAAVTLTAVIAGATAFTLSTAPTRYIPPVSPGQRIGDVPLNSGPQRHGEEDEQLHRKLLEEPAHGPERLVPESR
ncbi:sigma factor-like helix-turn-helix DNA-binding protein [Streptomyces sp. BPTC-684]|uniref:sigma factor-like helix-turn-helix DNA-binding protein n=1 Tax=Streptomyces sp. BPTC-684 TaxID=3043734 RepID=UPI0024B05CB2|nr:sigma factor-like helix-turn-helix DNA-binding protein [Streptomyces sp. BPTC-684]WHM37072.1 sigma factor-like helix-turn-helix DNA-binding protein [Streptomyces sp. BPTC-684]